MRITYRPATRVTYSTVWHSQIDPQMRHRIAFLVEHIHVANHLIVIEVLKCWWSVVKIVLVAAAKGR